MSIELVSCIILAGGEGKRFNREDKGLVELNNKPLIEHIIERIKLQVDDIVISANRNIDIYKKYASHVVVDQLEHFQGPLAGIAAALPYCQHPWILVVPCDIPLLPDDLVKTLNPTNASKLHVLKINGRLQLIFLLHKDLLPLLNQTLEQGHHKVMDWVEMQNPFIVELDINTDTFINLNTPEQLEKLSD